MSRASAAKSRGSVATPRSVPLSSTYDPSNPAPFVAAPVCFYGDDEKQSKYRGAYFQARAPPPKYGTRAYHLPTAAMCAYHLATTAMCAPPPSHGARTRPPPFAAQDGGKGIWYHGDLCEVTGSVGESGGVVVHGRSDTTLKPGGVRIGTAEARL